jgi:hypothetical protein
LSEVIGSWNTMANFPGADAVHLVGPAAERDRGHARGFAQKLRPGRHCDQLEDGHREVTVLPQPDSPTTLTVSPRPTVKSTPSTACTMPIVSRKMGFEPPDVQQRGSGGRLRGGVGRRPVARHHITFRGSSASRKSRRR